MTHITTIANDKGGVSKSLTTVQLAGALARRRLRVLVVDMDPQANATRRLGIGWDDENPYVSMAEVIKADQPGVGEEAVLPCGWVDGAGAPTVEAEYIDVLPSRYDLLNRETEAGVIGASRRLKKALEGWTERYDVVLIDTAPSLGHITQMAFAASDTVLIPTVAEYDSLEAAIRVEDFVTAHAADLANPNLRVAGVVITRHNDTLEHEFFAAGTRSRFGDLVWHLIGTVKHPNGKEELVPKYLREGKRYREVDSAATSFTAWNDVHSRKAIAAFDALAAAYISKILKPAQKAKAS